MRTGRPHIAFFSCPLARAHTHAHTQWCRQRNVAAPPQQAQQELAQYNNAWSSAEARAYYDLLKERYKVQINVAKPKDALSE